MERKNVNGCIGTCCEKFHLCGKTPEDLKEMLMSNPLDGTYNKEFFRIFDMLVYLGECDEDFITGEKYKYGTFSIYTCKYFDKENKICKEYEKRPNMCKDYGVKSKCSVPGCTLVPEQKLEMKEMKEILDKAIEKLEEVI